MPLGPVCGCSLRAVASVVATSCSVSCPGSPSVESPASPSASRCLRGLLAAGNARISSASSFVFLARASSGNFRNVPNAAAIGFSCSVQPPGFCSCAQPLIAPNSNTAAALIANLQHVPRCPFSVVFVILSSAILLLQRSYCLSPRPYWHDRPVLPLVANAPCDLCPSHSSAN